MPVMPKAALKTALVFGISGQDGSWLAKLLLERGYTVHGTSRDREASGFGNLRRLGLFERVGLHSAVLTDFRSVVQVISDTRPAEIYNLAGQSSVGLSFEQPVETLNSTALGTVNILEAIRFLALDARFYNASSSECFGNTAHGPADENHPFHPRSPYGVGKAAAYWAVANYRESYNLFACSGLLFNHESPLRPSRYVTQKIVRGAADIAEGKAERLHLGQLAVERDWGWAPEYAEAMWRMLNHDAPEDFVIATGHARPLEAFVRQAFEYFSLDWRQHVEIDMGLMRPSDIAHSVGDPAKAKRLLGWEAETRMEGVVAKLLDAEMERRGQGHVQITPPSPGHGHHSAAKAKAAADTRLKILIYSDDPDLGGAAACTHRQALGLAARGYQVMFAQTLANAARVAERERAGIRHFPIPYDTMECFYLASRDRACPADILARAKPDLVVFADSVVESSVAAKDIAAAMGIPYIIVNHSVVRQNPSTQVPEIRALIQRLSTQAAAVVGVSQKAKSDLVEEFSVDPAHVTVVPNWCEERFLQPPTPGVRERLRREWGAAEGDFVVASVGGVSHHKGFDLIVAAMRELAGQGRLERMLFVWIGNPDREFLPNLLAEAGPEAGARLRVLGPRVDVDLCLEAADAFLLPSRSETFGLSLLEAMAKGLPVLTTAIGGIPETVGDRAVLAGDPLADAAGTVRTLVATLAAWSDDPAQARAFGQRGSQRARQGFSEKASLDRLSQVIERAALPKGDYVSPGLKVVKLERRLPYLVILDPRFRSQGRRFGLKQNRWADVRDVHRIIPSRDEALLIHNLALGFKGRRALLIGAEVGWTATHIAAAGMALDILDPRLGDETLLQTLRQGLNGLGEASLRAGDGAAEVAALAAGRRPWALVVITPPARRDDLVLLVAACEAAMEADATLVIWNAISAEAGELLAGLKRAGWRAAVYDTAQIMAIACRGGAVMLAHRPDPAEVWRRPPDLEGFETAGLPAE